MNQKTTHTEEEENSKLAARERAFQKQSNREEGRISRATNLKEKVH